MSFSLDDNNVFLTICNPSNFYFFRILRDILTFNKFLILGKKLKFI